MNRAKNPRTFEEASAAIQANLQRHLERQKSKKQDVDEDHGEDISSSEEEDDDEANGDHYDEVLNKVFQAYNLNSSENGNNRTRSAIVDSFKSGRSSCLVCISSVRKHDAIWSCRKCFCSLHLSCVQRWGQDCIFQQKQDQENGDFGIPLQWACPNCRHVYRPEEIPKKYTCYCGKITDPPFDPWIVPHSCGETCNRTLEPECGHRCLILCHPGPCPPCPKMVTAPCYCRSSAPATRRCFNKEWSCGKLCNRTLNCGQHPCPLPCHPGPCRACQKTSVQLCLCQRHQSQRLCASPQWQCDEKCGRPLACGHHKCDLVCHEGKCPPCPLSLERKCPCGKSSFKLECTEATPTCGDTCGKLLECGIHNCSERCHRGSCGACLQMVTKSCRCGSKKKELQCCKKLTCDVKCKKLRDCRRHACNRKCCDGVSCPTCEQVCGRQLNCKNHKCASRCHTGSCYPCNLTKEVSCNCGSTRILVPCGREKTTKPPKCKQLCKIPPECHHEKRLPHNCHFGPCPPCKQICNLKMPCGHICPAQCHDQVKVTLNPKKKAAVPWEEVRPKVEFQAVDCPDCQYPVPITCLGGHETSDWPCFIAKRGSCGRQCGRKLKCGNHTCSRNCHTVKNAPNEVDCGSNCRQCEMECANQRPEGCTHKCPKPCHPGPCEPCQQMIRILCHCGLTQPYVKCGEWNSSASNIEEIRLELGCCKDQCPKLLSCNHRCTKTCHPGKCSSPEDCRKRVKLYCPCKRIKVERHCYKVKLEDPVVCDDECLKQKEKAEQEQEELKKKKMVEEEKARQQEVERFEKMIEGKGGKRRRNRRNASLCQEDPSLFQRYKVLIMVTSVLATVLGIGLYVSVG